MPQEPKVAYRAFDIMMAPEEANGPVVRPENRTFRMLLATEKPVDRGDFDEVLLMAGARLDKLKSGRAPLLRDHEWNQQLGVIESPAITDRGLEVDARLGRSAAALAEEQDLNDRIRTCVSVGYRIHNYEFVFSDVEGVKDIVVINDWEPFEGSTVSIPADWASGVMRGADGDLPSDLLDAYRAQRADWLAGRGPAPDGAAAIRGLKGEEYPEAREAEVAEEGSEEEEGREMDKCSECGHAREDEAAPEEEEAREEAAEEEAPVEEEEAREEEEAPADDEACEEELDEEEEPEEEAERASEKLTTRSVENIPHRGEKAVATTPQNQVESGEISTNAPRAAAQESKRMSDLNPQDVAAAERARIADIQAMGERHGLPRDTVAKAVNEGASVESFRAIALDHVATEARAQASHGPELTPREQRQYSLSSAVRAASLGEWDRPGFNSFEREIHTEMVAAKGHLPRDARSILVPYTLLGSRASSTTTGTGQHLVPNVHAEFQPFLTSDLAAVRAGLTVLTGLRGEIDFPGGDSLGVATAPGETGALTDSEATFRNKRATAKPVVSRATFSRQLLNNSVPAVDALIEGRLQERVQNKIENMIFSGNGSGGFVGLDNISGILDAPFSSNAVSYPAFLDMVTKVDEAKALLGEGAYITTRGVVNRGLTSYRDAGNSSLSVLNYAPNEPKMWMLDGERVFRTHEVKSNGPSPTSPSQLIAHSCYYGVWSQAFLCFFGPAMEIVVDYLTAGDTSEVIMRIYQEADFVTPIPECFAKAENILL